MAETTNSSNARIAKNTLMLYLRMLLTVLVGIYTSRVVLNTLGVEDYGINNVVGGVVSMLGFLNASLAGATSRFITFELGRGDKQRLADTFSSALIAHIGIAVVVILIAETVGLWFVTHKLVIPAERMGAALWVYHLSIASAAISITQVPYTACVIAHERMSVYAYMEILNSVLKLLIVYMLLVGNFDKLKLYAVLTFLVSATIAMIYRIYCIRKFDEAHFHWRINKAILRPMVSFSAWDVYGNLSASANHQGSDMILNVFFGPTVNAAAGIASIFTATLGGFANSVITAFRPQIVKSYARQDITEMQRLVINATKFYIILFLLIIIPIYTEIDYILKIWLVSVPLFAEPFCKAVLIFQLVNSLIWILNIPIQATGDIKLNNLINGSILLLTLLPTYLLLRVIHSPIIPYILQILMDIGVFAIDLHIIKKLTPSFNPCVYIYSFLPQAFIIGLLSSLFCMIIHMNLDFSFLRVITVLATSTISTTIFAYYIMFNKIEREMIKIQIKKSMLSKSSKLNDK